MRGGGLVVGQQQEECSISTANTCVYYNPRRFYGRLPDRPSAQLDEAEAPPAETSWRVKKTSVTSLNPKPLLSSPLAKPQQSTDYPLLH